MDPCSKLVQALLCSALILALLLHPSGASADVRLKVWPTTLEVSVAEGDAAGCIVNVQNEGDEPLHLRVYALDYTVDTSGAYHFAEPGPGAYSCAAWLDVDASTFDLAPGETRAATILVKVPQYVEPGEHHSALFIEHSEVSDATGVSIGARLACLFYVRVPGVTGTDVLAGADIVRLRLPGWNDGRPVNAGAMVRNTGNVHLTVAARAYFTDFRGSRVGEMDLGQAVILPGDDRLMEATWENPPLYGSVTAKVVIGYHDNRGELVNKEASASFQVIPWKLIMAVVLAMIAIALSAFVIRRRFRLRLSMERRGRS